MRLILLAALTTFSALQAETNESWKKLEFLLGEWTGAAGEKDTPIGAGEGAFSFEPQLNEKIIVRRNKASYTSGTQHEDLMVIYADARDAAGKGAGDSARAIYFDSEGHVIRYALVFPETNRVVFESDGIQPGPKYRLSYWMEGGELKGRFEVAAPGGEYKSYLNWTSKRR